MVAHHCKGFLYTWQNKVVVFKDIKIELIQIITIKFDRERSAINNPIVKSLPRQTCSSYKGEQIVRHLT